MRADKNVSSLVFSQRKKDHINISLKNESQVFSDQFSLLKFQHNPLPEMDFQEVSLKTHVFGHPLNSPLFVSSMTLGHGQSESLNNTILSQCEKRGWMMGVGSQRRQLFDSSAFKECESLRSSFPSAILFGNLGLSQMITTPVDEVQNLVDSLKAQFMVVHTNPLQEVLQSEGTPRFRGGLKALENLCAKLNCPVVLKETGCGFSMESFERLKGLGLAAVDVSGLGGTHWGRVEGLRKEQSELGYRVAGTFWNWGLCTVDSMKNGLESEFDGQLWASGGVRSGLDAAKLLAMGARKVGYAQPILKAALQGDQVLWETMEQLDQELKIALFCLGIGQVEALIGRKELLSWQR